MLDFGENIFSWACYFTGAIVFLVHPYYLVLPDLMTYKTFVFSLCRYHNRDYRDFDDIPSSICHTDCDGSESQLSDCNLQSCSETDDCLYIIFVECCKEK